MNAPTPLTRDQLVTLATQYRRNPDVRLLLGEIKRLRDRGGPPGWRVVEVFMRIIAIGVFSIVLATGCFWAGPAQAKWIFVVESPEGDIRWSLDNSRIAYDDTAIWVWFLIDNKLPQTSEKGTYYSIEVREEINCTSREESFFQYLYYAESGGRGRVVEADSFGGIGPFTAAPGSISESLVSAACDEFSRKYRPTGIKQAKVAY